VASAEVTGSGLLLHWTWAVTRASSAPPLSINTNIIPSVIQSPVSDSPVAATGPVRDGPVALPTRTCTGELDAADQAILARLNLFVVHCVINEGRIAILLWADKTAGNIRRRTQKRIS
jgi:hypothetical protein